jgi:predicted transcriptional regulator
MTVDEMILKAIKGGPVTVNDITADIAKHFISRVRIKLEKLRVRGVVTRKGRGGAHRAFTYQLIRPDRAAQAIAEKGGGLARVGKMTPKPRHRSGGA